MSKARLRVVVFQEGDWLCAHCLEYDFATQAKSLDALGVELERMITGHVAISLAQGLRPFANRPRAPERYWTLFRRSKIVLPPQRLAIRIKQRGVNIPTAEIRVAPLAA